MIIVPRVSQRLWLVAVLDYVRGNTPGPNPLLVLHLYRNDFAPGAGTVLADFTESDFPGYAVKFIGADFPFPVTNGDGWAESDSDKTYSFPAADQSSNQTVHGWYVTLQSDIVPAVLFCAERLVPGIPMNLPGATAKVRPKFVLGSRYS